MAKLTKKTADLYRTVDPQLEAMYLEFKEFGKSKGLQAINKKKIDIVNRLLEDCLKVLRDEPVARYLSLLDEDEMPEASDVLLMLSQFRAGLSSFEAKQASDLNDWH